MNIHIHGIPLHPLVVHATVVFVPLAALFAATYGVLPRGRAWLRWPMAVVVVAAAGSAAVAWLTGRAMKTEVLARGVRTRWIAIHQHRANILVLLVLLQLVVVAVAFFLSRPGATGAAAKVLPVLLVVVALAVLVSVALTGDAGARAVWAGA